MRSCISYRVPGNNQGDNLEPEINFRVFDSVGHLLSSSVTLQLGDQIRSVLQAGKHVMCGMIVLHSHEVTGNRLGLRNATDDRLLLTGFKLS